MSQGQRDGDGIVLPGIASVHSHAFQRALRGHGQALGNEASFWSWRRAMYELAGSVDPDAMGAIAEFAYAELAKNGVSAVGEFHYVQHAPDGGAYDDRTIMAKAVIDAARRVGIRITLLRVVYERPGFGRDIEGVQRRFADTPEQSIHDLGTLQAHYKDDPLVRFGIAPHSVRAVTRESLLTCHRYAAEHALPFHVHVSEQRREVRECIAEHGQRPVEYLHGLGAIDSRFVGVHATHLTDDECAQLAPGFVALCRTTERDLGDGLAPTDKIIRAGARLCFGVDSHALSDPFEEMRAAELDARTLREARQVALGGAELLRASTEHGYTSIGWAGCHEEDRVVLDAHDPSLRGATEATLGDAIAFGASGRATREVKVAGKVLDFDIRALGDKFDAALKRIGFS
ncbi:MAG: formimidoylglutamate deiminase [Polyangiales bacterium]|jgi:formimidoylglutamate deiminase